tara:strand:+ start:85 stop:324 length:240 start_codon:yes stop_codon:yes gene_type:complete
MKKNTYSFCRKKIDKENYLMIIKAKLDKKHFDLVGYHYEIDFYYNDNYIDNKIDIESYKELKQYLKDEFNILIKHQDFK